jgi:hypothetical protein
MLTAHLFVLPSTYLMFVTLVLRFSNTRLSCLWYLLMPLVTI